MVTALNLRFRPPNTWRRLAPPLSPERTPMTNPSGKKPESTPGGFTPFGDGKGVKGTSDHGKRIDDALAAVSRASKIKRPSLFLRAARILFAVAVICAGAVGWGGYRWLSDLGVFE